MTFEVCGIKTSLGEKKSKLVTAAELPIGRVKIPLTIINGEEPGPTLMLSAGIHGTEYPGIKGAQIIAQETEPLKLTGRMTASNADMVRAVFGDATFKHIGVTNKICNIA